MYKDKNKACTHREIGKLTVVLLNEIGLPIRTGIFIPFRSCFNVSTLCSISCIGVLEIFILQYMDGVKTEVLVSGRMIKGILH